MKIIQIFFLFFLIIPFIEIYLLLQIGGLVGVFPTILLVVFTAILGAWLLRQQGFSTWQRFQGTLARGDVPAYEMIEGAILLVGGALLLTPGFFTDVLGFAGLIPQIRQQVAHYILRKYSTNARQSAPSQPEILEGEYKRED